MYGNTVFLMLLFFPDYIFPKVTDLSPSFLKEREISLLLMDFDNTMLPYTTDTPTPQLLAWIAQMHAAGICLCIVSNSRKPRVPEFSAHYGVACETGARKPTTVGIRRAMTRFSAQPVQTALVGDQIFTDVLGANLANITSIHVKSIHNHTVWLKLRHVFEVPLLWMARKRRVEL